MNDITVPSTSQTAPPDLLNRLGEELENLTPELRKAAAFVLENPNEVGISSMREIAAAADVKPNTLVRMARVLGFDGYEDFREPFREEIRRGTASLRMCARVDLARRRRAIFLSTILLLPETDRLVSLGARGPVRH